MLPTSSAIFRTISGRYFSNSPLEILSRTRRLISGWNFSEKRLELEGRLDQFQPTRHYCRYPRHYTRNPIPFSRRLELPNPAFTAAKPPPSLDSLDYFQEAHAAEEQIEEVREVLYSSIEVETRAHDTAVLKSYETFALTAAKHFNLTVASVYVPREPYIRWFRTLLRSVHIFKKRRFTYETRTYYRRFTVARLTGSTADTFLEYIQRNLPEGVGMRVMRRALVERPDYLKCAPKMKALGSSEEVRGNEGGQSALV